MQGFWQEAAAAAAAAEVQGFWQEVAAAAELVKGFSRAWHPCRPFRPCHLYPGVRVALSSTCLALRAAQASIFPVDRADREDPEERATRVSSRPQATPQELEHLAPLVPLQLLASHAPH